MSQAMNAVSFENTGNDLADDSGDLVISQLVDYAYSNYAEVSWSNTELRLAFGDLVPGGGVRPRAGIVLVLSNARLLCDRLQDAIRAIEDENAAGLELEVEAPAGPLSSIAE